MLTLVNQGWEGGKLDEVQYRSQGLKRETGFEPATFSLASTPSCLPHGLTEGTRTIWRALSSIAVMASIRDLPRPYLANGIGSTPLAPQDD